MARTASERCFKIDAAGNETVLHGFGGADGANVLGAVVRDAKGNFYGTTEFGGDFGNGTVFRIDTSGQLTVLHSFADTPDGLNPYTGLAWGPDGYLYGTTELGGAFGQGTLFKINPVTGEESVYSFSNGQEGANPAARLTRDLAGNLYGVTINGGTGTYGTVFRVLP